MRIGPSCALFAGSVASWLETLPYLKRACLTSSQPGSPGRRLTQRLPVNRFTLHRKKLRSAPVRRAFHWRYQLLQTTILFLLYIRIPSLNASLFGTHFRHRITPTRLISLPAEE